MQGLNRGMPIIASCALLLGCGSDTEPASDLPEAREASSAARRLGYILRPGEGEVLGPDIIKASPRSGTQGSVIIQSTLRGPFSSGRHVHLEADELFYVVGGSGMISLGSEDHRIGDGYVVFVPAGSEHRIFATEGQQVEVIEFLDRPGLDEEFRAWHRRMADDSTTMTLEEVNELSRPNGTVYRTLQ